MLKMLRKSKTQSRKVIDAYAPTGRAYKSHFWSLNAHAPERSARVPSHLRPPARNKKGPTELTADPFCVSAFLLF
jgi:hypothetical protein